METQLKIGQSKSKNSELIYSSSNYSQSVQKAQPKKPNEYA